MQDILCKTSSVVQRRDREEGNSRFPGPASGNMQTWSHSAAKQTLRPHALAQHAMHISVCALADVAINKAPPKAGRTMRAGGTLQSSRLTAAAKPTSLGSSQTCMSKHRRQHASWASSAVASWVWGNIRSKPHLAVPAVQHGSGEPLLHLERHHPGCRTPFLRPPPRERPTLAATQAMRPARKGFYRGSTWTAEEVDPSATHIPMVLRSTTLLSTLAPRC